MIAKFVNVILLASISAVLAQDTTSSSAAQDPPPPEPTTTEGPPAPNPNFTPLASKHFTYTALPYQADTDTTGERGAQYGYNICNSTVSFSNFLLTSSLNNDRRRTNVPYVKRR